MEDFTKSVHALVYHVDPEHEELLTAHHTMLFLRNITDGRAMMRSGLPFLIGINQRMGEVEYGNIYQPRHGSIPKGFARFCPQQRIFQ